MIVDSWIDLFKKSVISDHQNTVISDCFANPSRRRRAINVGHVDRRVIEKSYYTGQLHYSRDYLPTNT